ncbi:MAG: DUF3613 domain-containing protein [Salinisphaera sp.]|nr:DUF3613 domain-containing protein [Salinisphaera sp.]
MKKLLFMLVACLPLATYADDITKVGETTERALEMQREGRGAVPNRPILKDVAERTYERYLESFTHPIPPLFKERQKFSDK